MFSAAVGADRGKLVAWAKQGATGFGRRSSVGIISFALGVQDGSLI